MSLKQAILDVAERMDADLIQFKASLDGMAEVLLRSYARELRTAATVATEITSMRDDLINPATAEEYHRQMIEQAKQEFRRVKEGDESFKNMLGAMRGGDPIHRAVDAAEADAPVMVEVLDGPAGGTLTSIPTGMPAGARTSVAGAVYQLTSERKLKRV